jgi:hypothetical protein
MALLLSDERMVTGLAQGSSLPYADEKGRSGDSGQKK